MSIAFDADTLTADPTWTALDQLYPSLVASYTIDRGRAYELDRVDTGRATVTISDRDGILDPTNTSGPYWDSVGGVTKIQPLKQVALARHNPFDDGWYVRFRGFIEEWRYDFDPSQRVNRLTLECVDIFELIQAAEMFPGDFGVAPPKDSHGYVYFPPAPAEADPAHTGMQYRVYQVLNGHDSANSGCQIPGAWSVVFSGNVSLQETVYSVGESAMTAIQEAVDAEFPAVGNVYCDRLGRLCVHGRFAKFDPVGTSGSVSTWDFHDWKAGDGIAVNASPSDTVQIREFGFSRGLSKIINRAYAAQRGIKDGNKNGQVVRDATSVGKYGIRPWSTENLLLKKGETTGLEAKDEAKTFASYYVDNYADPHHRIETIGFRSMRPGRTGSQANWTFLCECDISDRVNVRMGSPGGGSMIDKKFFVEGIHEEARPLQDDFDDVTLQLDLSPGEYFQNNPWA